MMKKKSSKKKNIILAISFQNIVFHSKKFHHFHWFSAKQCGAQVDEKSYKVNKQTNKQSINHT
jgi:hypothetical protein